MSFGFDWIEGQLNIVLILKGQFRKTIRKEIIILGKKDKSILVRPHQKTNYPQNVSRNWSRLLHS